MFAERGGDFAGRDELLRRESFDEELANGSQISSGSPAPGSGRTSAVRTCSTASGCAAKAAAPTPAPTYVPPTTCWPP
ncbi:hypothetical protein [Streptosporangium sp. CA-115845]|uniref:hypothetical protein n=1 Tax=Streptosporangium sp. CA-115845 TaxID=3240071 RepID=UPI003D914042